MAHRVLYMVLRNFWALYSRFKRVIFSTRQTLTKKKNKKLFTIISESFTGKMKTFVWSDH